MKPKLELWQLPPYYFGARWPDYYVFLGRNRDSSIVEDSNFECVLARLNALPPHSDDITSRFAVRENHWACGWIEWIAIHKDDHAAITLGNDILSKLARYPILDEDDYSRRHDSAIMQYWADIPLWERVDMCREYGESIFAARHDAPPSQVYYQLSDNIY